MAVAFAWLFFDFSILVNFAKVDASKISKFKNHPAQGMVFVVLIYLIVHVL